MRKSSTTAHSTGDPGSIGEEVDIAQVLVQLRSANPQGAWEQFLLQYGRVLYQAVRTSTRDEEAAADCFVFVSEKLAEKGYRRLLRFKPEGAASFVTWLRVVARNLSFDWQRKVYGRPRPFKFLEGLPALDLAVYQCRYERGLSVEDTLRHLSASWPPETEQWLSHRVAPDKCSILT